MMRREPFSSLSSDNSLRAGIEEALLNLNLDTKLPSPYDCNVTEIAEFDQGNVSEIGDHFSDL